MIRLRDENGFTLVELLVASVVTVIVLGGAVALASQIQNGYRRQLEDSAAEQEGRPVAGTAFDAIQWDPDGDTIDNDIRIQTDANPPDGNIGGIAGACDQANEDVTISLDAANNTIVFLDNNLGGGASTRTDNVIEDLRFVYRDSNHAQPVGMLQSDVVYVETRITIRTRTVDPSTGLAPTRTLSQEVRVRSR